MATQDSLKKAESSTDTLTYSLLVEASKTSEKEEITRESLFKGHSLQKRSEQRPILQQKESPWIFGVLLAITILFCWIFGSYRVRISKMFKACFSNRYMSMLIKDGNMLRRPILLPVAITYLPLLSLFIYKILNFYSIEFGSSKSYVTYILILLALTLFTFIKAAIINFLGNVFKSPYTSTVYIVNDIVYGLLIAIVLLPLLFVVFFSHTNLNSYPLLIVSIIISIIYLFKIIRGFLLALLNSKLSKLYLFYYLCIVEIFPILIIGKVLISSFRN